MSRKNKNIVMYNRKAEINSETLLWILGIILGLLIILILGWKYIAKPLGDINADDTFNALKKECKVGEPNCVVQNVAFILKNQLINFKINLYSRNLIT
jgi:hypothetical protein